jgi:hypothetical protein
MASGLMRRTVMMRSFCLVATLLLAAPAWAGFEFGKQVYRMDRLDAALAEARTKGEAVTFIYTTESTTCGLCQHASLTAADQFRKQGVVVYARSAEDFQALPALVKTALKSPEAGKFIPKTIVVNPEVSEVLAVVPYARGSEFDDKVKEARRSIRAYFKESPRGSTVVPPSTPAPPAATTSLPGALRVWRSASGAELEARLLRVTGYTVVLEKPDGNQVRIDLNKLSEADQQYVRGAAR